MKQGIKKSMNPETGSMVRLTKLTNFGLQKRKDDSNSYNPEERVL